MTITGSQDEEYEATTTTYQVVGDTLVDGAFVLTLWPEVTPAEMANAIDPGRRLYVECLSGLRCRGRHCAPGALRHRRRRTDHHLSWQGCNHRDRDMGGGDRRCDHRYDDRTVRRRRIHRAGRRALRVRGRLLMGWPLHAFKLEEITPEMMDVMTAPASQRFDESDTWPGGERPRPHHHADAVRRRHADLRH